MPRAHIESSFDPATSTVTHLVADRARGRAALIDSVLGSDAAAGRTSTVLADPLIARVGERGLTVDWLLETHAHADHLAIGDLDVRVMHTPGHTPACISYGLAHDAGVDAFIGDTLFMPDDGSARCDFPGGDAHALHASVRRLLALPGDSPLHLCHDHPPAPGVRPPAWVATVAEQRAASEHLHDDVSEADFMAMRRARDRTLAVPALLLPAIQVSVRAGQLPPAEANGRRYFKIPLDAL